MIEVAGGCGWVAPNFSLPQPRKAHTYRPYRVWVAAGGYLYKKKPNKQKLSYIGGTKMQEHKTLGNWPQPAATQSREFPLSMGKTGKVEKVFCRNPTRHPRPEV